MGYNEDLITKIDEALYQLKANIDSPQDINLATLIYSDLKLRIQNSKNLLDKVSLVNILTDKSEAYEFKNKSIDKISKSGFYYIKEGSAVTNLPAGVVEALVTATFLSPTDFILDILDLDTLNTYFYRGTTSGSMSAGDWKATSTSDEVLVGSSGFDNSDSDNLGTLSFNNSNRQVSLNTKNAKPIKYYNKKNLTTYMSGTPIIKVISNIEGFHYIYIEDNSIKEIVNPNLNGIKDYFKKCTLALIYWNVVEEKATTFLDKRYSTEFNYYSKFERDSDRDFFKYGELTSSKEFNVEVSNIEDITFSLSGGVINSIGLEKSIGVTTEDLVPILYRSGSTIKQDFPVSGKPLLNSGTGRLSYVDSANIVREARENDFVYYFLILTTDVINPIKILVGSDSYTSSSEALKSLNIEIQEVEDTKLNKIDFMFIGAFLMQTSSTYPNSTKSKVKVINGNAIIDLKNGLGGGGGSGGGLEVTSDTGSAVMPSGTTAQRDEIVKDGYLRFNKTLNKNESYYNGMWNIIDGGQLLGKSEMKAISYNAQVINEDIIIESGMNAYSVGKITIGDGYKLTIENNAVYKIL